MVIKDKKKFIISVLIIFLSCAAIAWAIWPENASEKESNVKEVQGKREETSSSKTEENQEKEVSSQTEDEEFFLEDIQKTIHNGDTAVNQEIAAIYMSASEEYQEYLNKELVEDTLANYKIKQISNEIFQNSIDVYDSSGILWDLYQSVGYTEDFTGYGITALINELTMWCDENGISANTATYLGPGNAIYQDYEDESTKKVSFYLVLNDMSETVLECEFRGSAVREESSWCHGIETSGTTRENFTVNLNGKSVKSTTAFRISELDKNLIKEGGAVNTNGETPEGIDLHGEAENLLPG